MLEGTILILKTEKESSAINDFFVIFNSIFIINEIDENNEQKNNEEKKSQNYIPDIQNEKNDDSLSQNILDNAAKNDNIDQEIGEIGNSNIEENNHFDENIYYDIDSDSLINVFNNLDNTPKNDNNNENNKK